MNNQLVGARGKFGVCNLVSALGVTFALVAYSADAQAGYVVVTTTADDDEYNGNCTLREAVQAVGLQSSAIDGCTLLPGPNEVRVGAGVYQLSSPITANSFADVHVVGGGHDEMRGTIIDGNSATARAFDVVTSINIANLTIRNFWGNALRVQAGAAALIQHTKLKDNGNFSAIGACAFNEGFFYMIDSECSGASGFRASAIYSGPDGILDIHRSSVIDRLGETGTIYNDGGVARISNSTIAYNLLTVRGSAVLATSDSVTSIQGSTIAYNRTISPCSGNCGALFTTESATIQLESSIVAHNIGGNSLDPDIIFPATCSGDGIISLGYNVMGIDSSSAYVCGDPTTHHPTDIIEDPLLITGPSFEPLGNGGVGRTYLPEADSPVLDLIPVTTGLCLNDQRNIGRASQSSCDIGAIERSDALFVIDTQLPTAGDAFVYDALERLGFEVSEVDDQTATAADASGKAVVVISNSVVSDNLTTTFKEVPRGVLVMEPFLYDDMAMAFTINLGFKEAATTILIEPHTSIGFNFGVSGDVQVTNSPQPFGFAAVNTSQAGFDAWVGIDQFIFSFSEGAMLTDGTPAPARRVGFFAGDGASADLTPDGTRLLEEAILRAAFSNQNDSLLSFLSFDGDSIASWFAMSGTLTQETGNFTQGSGSMSVNSSGYTRIDSIAFPTTALSAPGPELHLDAHVQPGGHPNPYYLGSVQLYVDIPSAGIHNQYISQVELTPLGSGWHTLAFDLPSNVQTALGEDHDDASFGIAVNTQPGSPPVLLDNLRFAD